ncbi:hypothetical protein KKH43_02840 [Patescibacteria group bacterium]|nr:hypothetical protein [Patescibacteria group bacterium]
MGLKPLGIFIIYGQPRTGSNLLVDLLNAHNLIHCEGGIFHPTKKRVSHPVRFPKTYIHKLSRIQKKGYYGFKIEPNEWSMYNKENLLDSLTKKGCKIIHIQRKNSLKQALSKYVADKTKIYITKRKQNHTKDMTVDVDQVIKMANTFFENDKEDECLLSKYNSYSVIYEKHLLNHDKWIASYEDIFNFLSVPPTCTSTRLKKIASPSLRDMIKNYDELERKVANTCFAEQL